MGMIRDFKQKNWGLKTGFTQSIPAWSLRKIVMIFLLLPWITITGCARTDPDKSIVLIALINPTNNTIFSGTGFVVAEGGYIVTNHHVISKTLASRRWHLAIYTEGKDTLRFKAEVVWSSPALDLALLRAPHLRAPALPINAGELEKEVNVTAIGFPGTADAVDRKWDAKTISTRTKGVISRVFHADWKNSGRRVHVVQHTATINKGNSGGPLINSCRQVVGVNTSRSRLGQGTFFSSHASELAQILKIQGIPADITYSRCGGTSWATAYIIIPILIVILGLVVGALFLFFSRLRSRSLALRSADLTPAPGRTFDDQITQTHVPAYKNNETEYHLVPTEETQSIKSHALHPSLAQSSGIIIGRQPPSGGIEIVHSSVSREHLRVTCTNSKPYRFYAEDLGSKNGTKLNRQIIDAAQGPVLLNPGDQLSLGKISYEFVAQHPNINSQTSKSALQEWILTGIDPQSGQAISIDVGKALQKTNNNELIIGRDDKFCDITLSHPSVSSRGHAKITDTGTGITLSDMRSTNGTVVNDYKLDPDDKTESITIEENMIIKLGSVSLRVDRK